MRRDRGGAGNFYLDSGKLWPTYVLAETRGADADWAGRRLRSPRAWLVIPSPGPRWHA